MIRLVLALITAGGSLLEAQGGLTPSGLAFEVVSIRSNTGRERMIRTDTEGDQFIATNIPVRSLVRLAYDIGDYQVAGGPGWIDTDRFDVLAKAGRMMAPMGGPFDGPPELRAMLRTLLADRFGLVARRETRQLPIFALVTVRPDKRLGPQLTASKVDCAALFAKRAPGADAPPCGIRSGYGSIVLEGIPIAQLAASLSGLLNTAVEDRTGLPGTFDLDLSWELEMRPGTGPSAAAESLVKALEAQAGLRLERTTGPMDVLVIERIERPTAN
jgi:uncharacterized protein (TIGR03435 family)